MSNISRLIVFTFIFLAGCNSREFKKTPGGMPYKVFKSGSGHKIYSHSFLKISATRMIEDSIIFTSKDGLPVFLRVDPNSAGHGNYDIAELWTSLEKGDSVVTIQLADTFIRRNQGKILPGLKKGDRIFTYARILEVFESDSAMSVDQEREIKNFTGREIAVISGYLEERKIKAEKTPGGAFVEIINPGQGNPIDSGQQVELNYKGISFSGTIFDTNTDSSFGHMEPLVFEVGSGAMIKGIDEGVRLLKKGAVAKIYIPSMLAYGPAPRTDKIKPYENIWFDVTVLDVKDKAAGKTAGENDLNQPKPH